MDDDYSRNFEPLIKFLDIINTKKDHFKRKAKRIINSRRSRPSSIDRDCQTENTITIE